MADRIVPLTTSADSPDRESPEILTVLTQIACGFQSRGLYTYVHSTWDLAADFYDDPSTHALPLPERPVIRRTARRVTDEFAVFFEFLRNSLRDIEKELEERSHRESRITSELFWRNFITKARNSKKTEPLSWDFKQTLGFWHAKTGDARRTEKFKLASDLASFANAQGGCLIVGITDDRLVVGVSDDPREIENRLKVTHEAIRDHFSYPRDVCRLLQVNIPDNNGLERVCFVISVPKTCEPAAAADGQGSYIFPQRTGSGTVRARKEDLENSRIHKKSDTYEFLEELDQFVG
jgi:hypothetical protein